MSPFFLAGILTSSLPGEWFLDYFTYETVCMCAEDAVFCSCEGNMNETLQGVCCRVLFMLFLKALERIDLSPPCLD